MGQWHIAIAGLPLLCPSLVVKYGAVARIFRVAGLPLLCPSLVVRYGRRHLAWETEVLYMYVL